MSDLDVINKYNSELIPAASFNGDLEVIDFFPHPLEDSSGNTIVDANGNSLSDWTPGEHVDTFHADLTPLVTIKGSIRGM